MNAEDSNRLIASLFVTGCAGALILGFKALLYDFRSIAHCMCGHEYNEHYVYPRGMVNPMKSEKCMICRCYNYRFNAQDKRNRNM